MLESPSNVIWLGSSGAEPEGLLTSMGLTVERFSIVKNWDALKRRLARARGIVLEHRPDKLKRAADLGGLMASLEIRTSSAKCLVLITEAAEVDKVAPLFPPNGRTLLSLTAARNPRELMTFFSETPKSGPNLDLDVRDHTPLSDVQRMLIKRSFADCVAVDVCPPSAKGFSANVMIVYGEMETQVKPFETVPYLVKFDDTQKIWAEHEKYGTYIRHHVPFYLRPIIEEDRCHWQGEAGIMVASFVEKTSSLLTAIDRGSGMTALHGLLHETLNRWWCYSSSLNQSAVPELVERRLKSYSLRAAKSYSAASQAFPSTAPSPDEMLKHLASGAPDRYRRGIMHGDLHAGNVLIRGGDAIIIDFPDCEHGPQLYDLAVLEISIWLATRPEETATPEEVVEWRRLSDVLYGLEFIRSDFARRDDSKSFAHSWNCVRYLRRFARTEALADNEYLTMLLAALMRRSMFGSDRMDELRALEAYILAGKLATAVAQG